MSKFTITRSSRAASTQVLFKLFPWGTKALDPNGNPVLHTLVSQTTAAGAWSVSLESTATMSPSGMVWEVDEGTAAPYYIAFSAAGDVDSQSLSVSAPASVGPLFELAGDVVAGLTLGTGLSGSADAINLAANLQTLAGKYGSLLVDKVHIAGITAKTAGGLGAWVAPAACVVFPTLCSLHVTTLATGTCNIDVGYTASSATTLADTLLDGVDGHTTGLRAQLGLGTPPAVVVNGTNEDPDLINAASGKWITLSAEAGGGSDPTAMVADFYVVYMLF